MGWGLGADEGDGGGVMEGEGRGEESRGEETRGCDVSFCFRLGFGLEFRL